MLWQREAAATLPSGRYLKGDLGGATRPIFIPFPFPPDFLPLHFFKLPFPMQSKYNVFLKQNIQNKMFKGDLL